MGGNKISIYKDNNKRDQFLFDKWNKWLTLIYTDIQQALINRDIFRETMAVIQANPKIHSYGTFYSWMQTVYSQAAIAAVRRQADRGKNVVSFARLLSAVGKSPTVISRERFTAYYNNGNPPEHIGHQHFDKLAGKGQSCISTAMIQQDLALLQTKYAAIKPFANKRIAHYDQKAFHEVPTWKELDDCLDLLETLLKKYLSMFRAEIHLFIVPKRQFEWKKIFWVPWIEKQKQ